MILRKSMDLAGAAGLIGFSTLLAFNQVVVKLTNDGISPVLSAGLRSAIGVLVLGLWIAWRRPGALSGMAQAKAGGLLLGLLFSAEFMALFTALDYTTVSRGSIVFYSMPVWLALAAHLWLPGERLTRGRLLGLVLAMAGVGWALWDPQSRSAGDWRGDALALLASLLWAGLVLTVRLGQAERLSAEAQLMWQVAVSALLLPVLAPLFGPLLRAPTALHWGGVLFQGVVVVGVGFTFWMGVMKRYRASDVAEAVRYLWGHPEEAQQMGERGRKAAWKTYNWETQADKLLAFYAGIV